MKFKFSTLEKMNQYRLMAVVREYSEEAILARAETYIHAGIHALSIDCPINYHIVLKAAKRLRQKYGTDSYVFGIASVRDCVMAREIIAAGFDFIAAPNFDSDIAELCSLYQIPYLPAGSTCNEFAEAFRMGADAVKIYPTIGYTPELLAMMRSLFSGAPFMFVFEAGEVHRNLEPWLEAGAFTVALYFPSEDLELAARESRAYVEDLRRYAERGRKTN